MTQEIKNPRARRLKAAIHGPDQPPEQPATPKQFARVFDLTRPNDLAAYIALANDDGAHISCSDDEIYSIGGGYRVFVRWREKTELDLREELPPEMPASFAKQYREKHRRFRHARVFDLSRESVEYSDLVNVLRESAEAVWEKRFIDSLGRACVAIQWCDQSPEGAAHAATDPQLRSGSDVPASQAERHQDAEGHPSDRDAQRAPRS